MPGRTLHEKLMATMAMEEPVLCGPSCLHIHGMHAQPVVAKAAVRLPDAASQASLAAEGPLGHRLTVAAATAHRNTHPAKPQHVLAELPGLRLRPV